MPSTKDDFFTVIEHEIEAQHLREYECAVIDEERPLRLSIKQYIPKSNSTPSEGDFTFIGSPALAIAKEAYEPFFEDLTKQLAIKNLRVKAFWIADPAQLGQSAVLNRGNLGNDFSWFDHSRDLLHVIQNFRPQMTRPLVALGHSMGGCQLTWLSLIHPGLFESLILVDPNILRDDYGNHMAFLGKTILKRREQWDSLQQAMMTIKKNPFYAKWDPRVLEKMIANQFVDISKSPSAEVQAAVATGKLKPKPGMVATSAPRLVEFNTGWRQRATPDFRDRIKAVDQTLYDKVMKSSVRELAPWFPASGITIINFLPFVKCRVIYIVGEKSDYSTPWLLEKRLKETGIGFGGSGGAAKGKVQQYILKQGDHYDIFDAERSKEIVSAATEHLVEVHTEYMEKLADWKEWQRADPQVQQMGPRQLVETLEVWNPKKGPGINEIVRTRAKI